MAAFAAASSGGYRMRTASLDHRGPYGNTFHSLYNGPAGLRCIDFAPRKLLRRQRQNRHGSPLSASAGEQHRQRADSQLTVSTHVSEESSYAAGGCDKMSPGKPTQHLHIHASDVAKSILKQHQTPTQQRRLRRIGSIEQQMKSFEHTVIDSQLPAEMSSSNKNYMTSSYRTNSSPSSSEDFEGNSISVGEDSEDDDDDSVSSGSCFAEGGKRYRFQNFSELVSDANAWLRAHPDMRVVNCESILMLANRHGDVETKSEFTIHNDAAYHQRYVRLLRVWMQPSDICSKSSQGLSKSRRRFTGSSNSSSDEQQQEQPDQIGFRDLSGAFDFSNDSSRNGALEHSMSNATALNELIRKFNETVVVQTSASAELGTNDSHQAVDSVQTHERLHIGRLICVHTTYANAREVMTHQLRFQKLLSLEHAASALNVEDKTRTPLVLDASALAQQKSPLSASKSLSTSRSIRIKIKSDANRKSSKKLQRHKSNKTDALLPNEKHRQKQPTVLKWYQVLRIFFTMPTSVPPPSPQSTNGQRPSSSAGTSRLMKSLESVEAEEKSANNGEKGSKTGNGVFVEDFWPSPLNEDAVNDEIYYENPCLAVETLPSLFDKIADWVQARAATIRVLNFQTIFVPENCESSLETSYTVQVKNDGQPTRVRMRKVIRLNYTNVYREETDGGDTLSVDNVRMALDRASSSPREETERKPMQKIPSANGLNSSSAVKNKAVPFQRNYIPRAECDKLARKQSHTLLCKSGRGLTYNECLVRSSIPTQSKEKFQTLCTHSHTAHKLFYPGTVKEERMASGFIPGRTVESARHVLGRIDAWAAKECVKVINVETITTPYSTGVERNYGFDLLMTEINVAADTPSLFVGEFLHIYRVYCDGFYSDDSVQSKIDPPTDPSESCTIL